MASISSRASVWLNLPARVPTQEHYPLENPFMIRTKHSPRGVAAAVALLGLSTFSHAGIDVGVFVEKPFVEIGKATPKLSVSAFNDGADATVDVHFGLVAPDGSVYEYPDWNTELRPWLSSFTLPAGLRFPATEITNLDSVPGGLTPGVWYVASVLTKPGTFDFLAVDLQPFSVADPAVQATTGTRVGALTLSLQDGSLQGVKTADAFFWGVDTQGALGDLVNAYGGDQPAVDSCRFDETSVNLADIGSIEGLVPKMLDAGSELTLSGAGSSLTLPRDSQVFQGVSLNTYHAGLGEGFYQTGVEYTFTGTGGADVGPFTAKAVAPAPLVLTQPNPASIVSQNAASDMPLRWNGSHGKGLVAASMASVALGGTTKVFTISCLFADDGEGTIPAALIGQLKARVDANGTDLAGLLGSLGNGGGGVDLSGVDLSGLGIDLSSLDLSNLDLSNLDLEALGLGGANLSPVVLAVLRSVVTPFNTDANDLSAGFFSITSGVTVSVTLN